MKKELKKDAEFCPHLKGSPCEFSPMELFVKIVRFMALGIYCEYSLHFFQWFNLFEN